MYRDWRTQRQGDVEGDGAGGEGGQQSLVYLERHSSKRGETRATLKRYYFGCSSLPSSRPHPIRLRSFLFPSRVEESNLEKVGQPLLSQTTFSLITKDISRTPRVGRRGTEELLTPD